MSSSSRFLDKAVLVDALLQQRLVQGDKRLANALAGVGELVTFAPGELLMEQGTTERDIFFLLMGCVRIIVNGACLYPREAGYAVGQISAIDARIPRAATVEAEAPVVALRITSPQFGEIAKCHPRLWQRLALELGNRIAQRNRFIRRTNIKPRVFLICSQEALAVAQATRASLEAQHAQVVLWSDEEIFPPGSYPLENLEREVNLADFGIAFAQPDDLLRARDQQLPAPRNNVIFELGFFMSRLGRSRTLLLVPRGQDMHLPSDFKGLLPLYYDTDGPDLATALAPTAARIARIIADLGVRPPLFEAR